jgi:hypothetical protein
LPIRGQFLRAADRREPCDVRRFGWPRSTTERPTRGADGGGLGISVIDPSPALLHVVEMAGFMELLVGE